jgi:hypothetical protein
MTSRHAGSLLQPVRHRNDRTCGHSRTSTTAVTGDQCCTCEACARPRHSCKLPQCMCHCCKSVCSDAGSRMPASRKSARTCSRERADADCRSSKAPQSHEPSPWDNHNPIVLQRAVWTYQLTVIEMGVQLCRVFLSSVQMCSILLVAHRYRLRRLHYRSRPLHGRFNKSFALPSHFLIIHA